MSGLHEAFDELVADVPVYGDLDRAIQQAERDRRRRYGAIAGLAAAAALLVLVAGIAAVSRDLDSAPANLPRPAPTPAPTPTTAKSQSPETWADTAVDAGRGYGWDVPNPLAAVQDAWFPVVAEQLDPGGGHLRRQGYGGFVWSGDGSAYSSDGRIELLTDRGPFEDGCHYLGTPPATNGTESCGTERLTGADGERARVSRYQRLCGSWDPGREGDDARPGPGSTYATCGDFRVAVAVERRDGLIGYLVVNGRGTPDDNPVPLRAMVDAAADGRLTLPRAAFTVPSEQAATAVVSDHFPRYQDAATFRAPATPGSTSVGGRLGNVGFSLRVLPAGADPVCGRSWLVACLERHVFGADDPTTVYVGQWDEQGWADVEESVLSTRTVVYVGPRHTVVAGVTVAVKPGEETLGAGRDQRLIDLVLDPRLQ